MEIEIADLWQMAQVFAVGIIMVGAMCSIILVGLIIIFAMISWTEEAIRRAYRKLIKKARRQ